MKVVEIYNFSPLYLPHEIL